MLFTRMIDFFSLLRPKLITHDDGFTDQALRDHFLAINLKGDPQHTNKLAFLTEIAGWLNDPTTAPGPYKQNINLTNSGLLVATHTMLEALVRNKENRNLATLDQQAYTTAALLGKMKYSPVLKGHLDAQASMAGMIIAATHQPIEEWTNQSRNDRISYLNKLACSFRYFSAKRDQYILDDLPCVVSAEPAQEGQFAQYDPESDQISYAQQPDTTLNAFKSHFYLTHEVDHQEVHQSVNFFNPFKTSAIYPATQTDSKLTVYGKAMQGYFVTAKKELTGEAQTSYDAIYASMISERSAHQAEETALNSFMNTSTHDIKNIAKIMERASKAFAPMAAAAHARANMSADELKNYKASYIANSDMTLVTKTFEKGTYYSVLNSPPPVF